MWLIGVLVNGIDIEAHIGFLNSRAAVGWQVDSGVNRGFVERGS